MSRRRVAATLVALAFALLVPAAGRADHIGISASITARLLERTGSSGWSIEIRSSVTCVGAIPGASNFSGDVHLVDLETGKEYYLGGTAGPGRSTAPVDATKREHTVAVRLKMSCWESGSLHGAGPIEVGSNPVLVPALFDTGEGGPDASGGGGGGSSSRDPTEPLADGGCKRAQQGTDGPDVLTGTNGGDIIFGYGGSDRIEAESGHDCLLGGRGNDSLDGGGGNDRLTGGSGNDKLSGGTGTNAYDAGSGNDTVEARNGKKETVRCGSGNDRARVDKSDRVSGCERVSA